MDVSKLNTKKPAETGAFLHLTHPVLGHVMYDGEDANVDTNYKWNSEGEEPGKLGLFIRGRESETVEKVVAVQRKKRLKSGELFDDEKDTKELLRAMVISFQGLERDGKPLQATASDIDYFFSQSDDFEAQVLRFSAKDANFFEGGSQK